MKMDQNEQLKDLNQKYHEDIISLMPGHVYWKDKNGVFLGCNLQQAKDAGFNMPEDMIGKTDHEMPWGIQASYLQDIDRKVMESRRPLTLEELFELPDGTRKTYLSNKIPLYDNENNVSGILGISLDITDRKQLEENLVKAKNMAEIANQAKTNFLENMRHDIRTPLTGIVGFAEIIKKETKEVKVKEYTDNLIAASYTLLDFLNEILEAIKVLTGDIPDVKKKFSLYDLSTKIIQLVKPKALEKQLNLDLIFDKKLPQYVIGDPGRIQRILIELVSNALNFTKEGNITVAIELANKKNRELIVKCSVKDTGIGIPADKQEEIFVRFRRLTPSYEGIYKGTGLGLAIVKQFTDDLKGEIYCQSKECEGSTFISLIPISESLLNDAFGVSDIDINYKLRASEHRNKIVALVEKPAGKTSVLLVEDQALAALVAESIITELDCTVDVASNGESAMKYFNKNTYDLIFMDVGLPDTNGCDLTKLIRAQEWKFDKHVPIVALTAHIDSENKQKCIESGMDAVLSKPLTYQTAQDIINAFVPSRRSGDLEENKAQPNNKLFEIAGDPIDIADGIARINGNEEKAKKLIGVLVKDFVNDLSKARKAKENSNWEEIRAVAHKLHGGSLYCGTPRLREACARLENNIMGKNTELYEQLYQQFLNEIDNVNKAFATMS